MRKTLSTSLTLLAAAALLNFYGCSSNNPGNDGGGTPDRRDTGRDNGQPDNPVDVPGDAPVDVTRDGGNDLGGDTGPDGGGFPPAPAIGATQLDRMGRPAVNTALTDPFFDYMNGAAGHHTKQDAYNTASDPSTWNQFVPQIQASLAAFDSLDGTCGNSVGTPGLDPNNPYATIATALADDRLFVNTASSTCQVFLGVEANALAAVPTIHGGIANTDCGGRTPLEDTVGILYSFLSGVFNDGMTLDIPTYSGSAPDTGATATTFPWLADPLQ